MFDLSHYSFAMSSFAILDQSQSASTEQIIQDLLVYIRYNKSTSGQIAQQIIQHGVEFLNIYSMLSQNDDVEIFMKMLHALQILLNEHFYHISINQDDYFFTILTPVCWGQQYDPIVFEFTEVDYHDYKECNSYCFLKCILMLESKHTSPERISALVKQMSLDKHLLNQCEIRFKYIHVNYFIKYGDVIWIMNFLDFIQAKCLDSNEEECSSRFVDVYQTIGLIHRNSKLFLEERKQLLLRVMEHKLFKTQPSMIVALSRNASRWSIRIILKRFNLFNRCDLFHPDTYCPKTRSIVCEQGCLTKLAIASSTAKRKRQRNPVIHKYFNEYYALDIFDCEDAKKKILFRIVFFLKYTTLPEDLIWRILRFEFFLFHPNLISTFDSLLRSIVFSESRKFRLLV